MRRKKHRGIRAVAITAVVIAGLVTSYCVYAGRYKDTFIDGTYINGIDAGGMNAEEVETAIRNRVEDYSVTLTFRDGAQETLSAEDIGFRYSSDRGVGKLMSAQNPYEWILGKFGSSSSYTVGEAYTYDADKLAEAMDALPQFDGSKTVSPQNAHMKMDASNRLIIVPEVDGNELRREVVLEALKEAVESGKDTVDVGSLEDAYLKADIRSDNEALNTQVNDLNTYLDLKITYDMYDGSKVVVDRDKISRWLSVKDDDPNYYYLNTDVLRAKCQKFMKNTAKKYDKTYDSMSFHSTNRGTIVIPTETTGYVLDQVGEADELYNTIIGRKSDEREPLYTLSKIPYDNISRTYVEVDLAYQHVYYYHDGEMWFDTSCVSGTDYDSDRRTPTGVFSIIEKDTSRVLRGEPNPYTGEPSYESFVNYWMRFYEGCGLHDATWRSSFGGDIYEYSGSHGCVNLPYSAAETLYGLVEYGTPVIVI